MAISKYEVNGKEYWKVYVHFRSNTNKKKRFQKSLFNLTSETVAKKEEKKLIAELSKKVQRYDGLGLTWSDVVHLWWNEVQAGYLGKVSERSAKGYLSILNKWTSEWNSRPAAELTRVQGRDLLIKLERKNIARSYQKKIKNIIGKVFEWGIEFGHIKGPTHSPMRGLAIEKGEVKPPDIFTLDEIKKFLSAARLLNYHWYPVWAFAVLTGMRSGELHALSWDQIDLEKNIILVDRSYDSNTKTVGPTKGRYWRTVPINSSLLKLILDLRSKKGLCEKVLPRCKDWDNGDQAVPLRNFLNSINMKVIKFHALRACFATQMLANGVPAAIVMKIGGWKKMATMDIYLRLAGVDTKGATDSLQFDPDNITFGNSQS